MLFSCLIRFSFFQSYIAEQASAFFSKEWQAEVNIGKVDVMSFGNIYLSEVYLSDQNKDTLAYVGYADMGVSLFDLKPKSFIIDHAFLDSVKFYLRKSDSTNINLSFIIEYFSNDKPKTGFEFGITNFGIHNGTFAYVGDSVRREEHFSPKYIYLENISALGQNLSIINGVVNLRMDALSTTDHSGLELRNFKSNFTYDHGLVSCNEITFASNSSKAVIDSLAIQAPFENESPNWSKTTYFVDVDTVHFELANLKFFSHKFDNLYNDLQVHGNVYGGNGFVKSNGVSIKLDDLFQYKGGFDIKNYTSLDRFLARFNISSLSTNVNDFSGYRFNDSLSMPELPYQVKSFGDVNASGDILLSKSVVQSNLVLQSENGDVDLDFTMTDPFSNGAKKNYVAKVVTENFNAGNMLEINQLGGVTSRLKLKGYYANVNDFQLYVDTSDFTSGIEHMEFNDRGVDKILLNEFMMNADSVVADVHIFEDLLNLEARAHFDTKGNQAFDIKLRIDHFEPIDLFPEFPDTSVVKGNLVFGGIDLKKDPIWYARMDDLFYSNKHSIIATDYLNFMFSPDRDTLSLESDLADLHVKGKFVYKEVKKQLQHTAYILYPNYFHYYDTVKVNDSSEYLVIADLKQPESVNRILGSPLDQIGKFKFYLSHDVDDATVDVGLSLERAHFGNWKVEDIDANCTLTKDEVVFRGGIASFDYKLLNLMSNIKINSTGTKGGIHHDLRWLASDSVKSVFLADTRVERENLGTIIYPGPLNIADKRWRVSDTFHLAYRAGKFHIGNLQLEAKGQHVHANGIVGDKITDKLTIDLKNISLLAFNYFLPESYHIDGRLFFKGVLSRALNSPLVVAESEIKNFTINNSYVGNIQMSQHWNNAVNAIDINGQLAYTEQRKFDFYGVYYLGREKENIDLMMDFNDLSLTALAGVMKPFGVSSPSGDLNGFLTVSGELNNPKMNGELDLTSGSLKVDMLEATFRTEGKVQVLPDAVYMDYQKIYDELGNLGYFNLTLNHTAFKDFIYEIYLDVSGDNYTQKDYYFQVMNSKRSTGLPIYGKALVQSDISISGYNKNIEVESPKLKIVDGSQIYFPVYSDEAENSTEEFMTFVDPYDTLEKVIELEEQLELALNINLEITSGTNLAILFDELGEDALRTNGTGKFEIKYKYEELKLSGVYTVSKGNYTVSLGKIAAKPFQLREGGTVKWNGDPYKANVNLQAVYKTSASIKELMNTTGGGASGNQTVYAIINLKDNLFDPVLSFNIEVPNTDENGRMALERVKATEEELNKQFFSLILFGKFLPLDGSDMADVGAGIVGSTASELISSQISSALSQLSDKYEVQFRYDTDDFTTNNEVAVELSTEFLDGRLRVGGAFGVSHSSMDGGQSNIIGDINVEYILDEEGHLSVKAYNQSNEFDITETNLGRYTQGISFKFQDDFNSWEDFFLYKAIRNLKRDNRNTDDIPEEWKLKILEQIREDEKSTDSE